MRFAQRRKGESDVGPYGGEDRVGCTSPPDCVQYALRASGTATPSYRRIR